MAERWARQGLCRWVLFDHQNTVRGYTVTDDRDAATYIARQFRRAELKAMGYDRREIESHQDDMRVDPWMDLTQAIKAEAAQREFILGEGSVVVSIARAPGAR